ncbi:MAG: cytochrome c biogenesis protein CcsA [Planctomycetia bacterium]|nr:cytochrome c biogenesis protein CcsA [Planctomycetia bacterium]
MGRWILVKFLFRVLVIFICEALMKIRLRNIQKDVIFSFVFRPIFLFLVIFCLFSNVFAGEKMDFSMWESLPVMHEGRIMPMEAYARMLIGEKKLKFSLEASGLENMPAKMREIEAESKMSVDKYRRFTPSEMIFSWLVEPEMWMWIPFLSAENEELRRFLEVPIYGKSGKRLRHVSPYQLSEFYKSPKYQEFLKSVEKAREGSEKNEYPQEHKELIKELLILQEEEARFQAFCYRPEREEADRTDFLLNLMPIFQTWEDPGFQEMLSQTASVAGDMSSFEKLSQAMNALRTFSSKHAGDVMQDRPIYASLESLDEMARNLSQASSELQKHVNTRVDTIFASKERSGLTEEDLRQEQFFKLYMQNFVMQTRSVLYSLYDSPITLYVIPSLDPSPLDVRRNEAVKLHPWLSLNALLYGSMEGVLKGYPEEEVKVIRASYAEAVRAWKQRDSAGFQKSVQEFSERLRAAAEKIEPLRQELLPEKRRDREILENTAYPESVKLSREVYYYKLKPFWWAWVFPFIGMLFLCFSGILNFVVQTDKIGKEKQRSFFMNVLSRIRTFSFWLGFILLGIGLFETAYGLLLRGWIMERAPVTNSFETIVFVSLIAGLMGMWFTLRPVLDPFFHQGWQSTAFPWTSAGKSSGVISKVMFLPRLLCVAGIIWLFAIRGYGHGEGYNAIHLLPQVAVGASTPVLSDVIIWLSGILTLFILAWWVPRFLLVPVAGVVIMWTGALREENKEGLKDASEKAVTSHEKILQRNWFAVATAVSVFLISGAPFLFQEQFNQNLRNLMPILRDNYWLAVHVMVIVGSYGAGMLAWVFALFSLIIYTFGKYIKTEENTLRRSPPEICKTLSDLMYRCIQAATLMLVIGTILGGLWADVSWGRFWSWDRKEVWALITLFIYLAILHGRYVRLLGEFTLAIGSILGALAIITAWFGVNYFIGSALHAYGSGQQTSLIYFGIVASLNLLLIFVAILRYQISARHVE